MMVKYIYLLVFCLVSFGAFAQDIDDVKKSQKSIRKTNEQRAKEKARKAAITSYKIISLEKDTTIVDTSLTIKSLYKYNYLKRDIFGLMPFPNEGQTYNMLNFGLNHFSALPNFGHKAKHSGYIQAHEINYYNVATPLTELYFKTVMEQGQNVDAFVTLNTSPQFNFSIAFKGLRSLGKYINQLSSTGNFRFTASYNTINKRYLANFHFTGQDLSNGENGGITTPTDFEGENTAYKNRARLQVYSSNAKSFLKGKRFFLDHLFRVNKNDAENNLSVTHQLQYEHKFFEYDQPTITSTIGTNTTIKRFGEASSAVKDQTTYDYFYNKGGILYENKTLGKLQFYIENLINTYTYDREIDHIVNTITYPNKLSINLTSIGGQYQYRKNKWNGIFTLSNAITVQSNRNLEAKIMYKHNDKNAVTFTYQNISKLPDNAFNLYQSGFEKYNWNNNFNNEKINNLTILATTQWFDASAQITTLDDYLYYSNDANTEHYQYITPKQYSGTIKYLSAKISKEFKFKKFALDNTILYQQTAQTIDILNVPKLVTRNTLYFSDYYFKRALYLQTGFTCNYFTKYYANDYNPVIADFFVQNQKQIGNFPMLDFFVNARIRQTRIFVIAEHFNSSFTGNTYYSAPNTPYRDFMIRFGLVWNFFQ